jgi:hypothetical protein
VAFAFEITRISRLAKAGVGVWDGELLEGSVTTGSTVELLHNGQRLPVRIKGVVLGPTHPQGTNLSLTVDLREAAAKIAAVGDRLVCA